MSDDNIVVISDRNGKFFWTAFVCDMTIIGSRRMGTEAWCRQDARNVFQKIEAALKDEERVSD